MNVVIKNIIISDHRVSADVYVDKERNQVWYEFNQKLSKKIHPGNAFLVAFLPIAMQSGGGTMKISAPVSSDLIAQMRTYQDIMLKWFPELGRVEIRAQQLPASTTNNKRKTISCFTGGVDAFYTLIKHQAEIDDLLYVWGFDIPLTEQDFYMQVKSHLESCAKQFKKKLVLVKTNIGFEVTNKYANWGLFCNGGAIASVMLLMSDQYSHGLIPSSHDYSYLIPRGSHVLLDPLRNCDGLSFGYDGAESSRIEKVDAIADHKIVQDNLRVCYQSHNEYNCGVCEKCIRTMTSLEALGKLSQIKTFAVPLDARKIKNAQLSNDIEAKFARTTMEVAKANHKDRLARQLCLQLKKYQHRETIKRIGTKFHRK